MDKINDNDYYGINLNETFLEKYTIHVSIPIKTEPIEYGVK